MKLSRRQQEKLVFLFCFACLAIILFLSLRVAIQNRKNYALYREAGSQKSDLQKMKQLIDSGADVNARIHAHMDGGWTPLHRAVSSADYSSPNNTKAVIEFLLANGADVNAKDPNESTALMEAAREYNSEIVRLLISKGADVNFRHGNTTALSMAQTEAEARKNPKHPNYVETVRLLKAAGAKE